MPTSSLSTVTDEQHTLRIVFKETTASINIDCEGDGKEYVHVCRQSVQD